MLSSAAVASWHLAQQQASCVLSSAWHAFNLAPAPQQLLQSGRRHRSSAAAPPTTSGAAAAAAAARSSSLSAAAATASQQQGCTQPNKHHHHQHPSWLPQEQQEQQHSQQLYQQWLPQLPPHRQQLRGLHHGAAAVLSADAGTDEDSFVGVGQQEQQPQPAATRRGQQQQQQQQSPPKPVRPSFGWGAPPEQPQHQQQLHHLASAHGAVAGPFQQQQQAQHQQQPRYQGHLHAPHAARRHASSSIERMISEQLLSCKSLGMLRRIMLKHKAMMEPCHVADTLVCLQHLVRVARAARGSGSAASAAVGFMPHPLAAAMSQARAQPRVRAAGELGRSRPRSAESDGHMEQLVAQMCGELGSMIWFQMGDMAGADLAKILYSWGMLEWHPEPELLADVKASFVAAAAGGGVQPHNQPDDAQAAAAAGVGGGSDAWLAAGLWGLAKLGEPFEGGVLSLLQQHVGALLALWTPQQLADVAAALVATADEQVAAGAATLEAEQAAADVLQRQLAPCIVSLARQLVATLADGGADGASGDGGDASGAPSSGPLHVPLPWPERELVLLQHELYRPHPPPSSSGGPGVAQAAAAAPAAADEPAPLLPVPNVPQLAWRLLQALAAVGLDVSSDCQDPEVGAVVAALSDATKAAAQR